MPTAVEIFGPDQSDLAAGAPRTFEVGDGRYVLTLPTLGIAFDLDHLRRDRSELIGELLVKSSLAGARTFNGVLSIGDLNLSSTTARAARAKLLAQRAKTTPEEFDWHAVLEEFVIRVLAAERTGAPAISLADVSDDEIDEPTITVDGWPLLIRHPQIWFGLGGAAKSLLAIRLAGDLTRRGLHVLYVDWELSPRDHAQRLRRIFGRDSLPAIQYIRAERPITHEIDRVRRIVREDKIDFAIFDSVGFAALGAPEAAETALTYFRAIRQLGEIGTLHIAHQTKAEDGDRAPFGSVYWFNSARLIWYLRPAEIATPGVLHIGAYCRKSNLDALHPALGFEIAFTAERIGFTRVSAADVPDLAAALPIRQRMAHALRGGAMTADQLADELGASVETINRTARRHRRLFTLVKGRDGRARLGLLDDRGTRP